MYPLNRNKLNKKAHPKRWDERMYIDMKNTPNSKGKIPERTRVIKDIKKSFQANTTKHKLPSTDKINQPPKK